MGLQEVKNIVELVPAFRVVAGPVSVAERHAAEGGDKAALQAPSAELQAEWQAEAEHRLAEARDAWKAEEGERLAAAESAWQADNAGQLEEAKAAWQAEELGRLARAKAAWKKELQQQLAEAKAASQAEPAPADAETAAPIDQADTTSDAAAEQPAAPAGPKASAAKPTPKPKAARRRSKTKMESGDDEMEKLANAVLKRREQDEERQAKAAAARRKKEAGQIPARSKVQQRLNSIVHARQEREKLRDAAVEAKRLAQEKIQQKLGESDGDGAAGGKSKRNWKWLGTAVVVLGLSSIPDYAAVYSNFDSSLDSFGVASAETMYVWTNVAEVRADPSDDAPVVGTAFRYEAVVVLRRMQSWIKVSLPNSNVLEGWIHSSLLTAKSN